MEGSRESGFEELLEQVIRENHHAKGWKGDVERVGRVEGGVGRSFGCGLGVSVTQGRGAAR